MGALNNISEIIVLLAVFTLGWGSHEVLSIIDNEQPSIINGNTIGVYPKERLSPSDIIKEENIHVYNDKIIIDVDDPEWAKFTDTNSMDPLIDEGANALQIKPKSNDQVRVGDIISFVKGDAVIIHRVIETGYDDKGWYAITKGDNNPKEDPGKVRFNNVKKVLFGIIY